MIKLAFAELSSNVDLISPRPDNRYQVAWKDKGALIFLTRMQLLQVGWTGYVYPRDDALCEHSSSPLLAPPLSLSSISLDEPVAPSPPVLSFNNLELYDEEQLECAGTSAPRSEEEAETEQQHCRRKD